MGLVIRAISPRPLLLLSFRYARVESNLSDTSIWTQHLLSLKFVLLLTILVPTPKIL